MIRKQKLVAEIKTKSPFGFSSDESWDELAEAAIHFGDIISVHTDPKWGGSFDLIEKVRAMTDKPILAKGIHSKDEEVREAIKRGANYVLVVDRIPVISLRSVCWFEPSKTAQLSGFNFNIPTVVWNSRDLTTGNPKKESWEKMKTIYSGTVCQASYIKNLSDVKEDTDFYIVGENLLNVCEQIKKAETC